MLTLRKFCLLVGIVFLLISFLAYSVRAEVFL